ncbi:hypothetical protein L9F63_001307, partial [Diploptera punctata]
KQEAVIQAVPHFCFQKRHNCNTNHHHCLKSRIYRYKKNRCIAYHILRNKCPGYKPRYSEVWMVVIVFECM